MDLNNRDPRYVANLFIKDMRAANLIVTRFGKGDKKCFVIAGKGLRVWFHPVSHRWRDDDKGLAGKGVTDLKRVFGFGSMA